MGRAERRAAVVVIGRRREVVVGGRRTRKSRASRRRASRRRASRKRMRRRRTRRRTRINCTFIFKFSFPVFRIEFLSRIQIQIFFLSPDLDHPKIQIGHKSGSDPEKFGSRSGSVKKTF